MMKPMEGESVQESTPTWVDPGGIGGGAWAAAGTTKTAMAAKASGAKQCFNMTSPFLRHGRDLRTKSLSESNSISSVARRVRGIAARPAWHGGVGAERAGEVRVGHGGRRAGIHRAAVGGPA